MTQQQSLEIRELASTDLHEVAALYVRVFNAPPWNDEWTEQTAAKRLTDTFNTPYSLGFTVWVAGRLIGVALGYEEQWFSGTHFYLKEMFVDPVKQGRGVGTHMMNHLNQVVRARGLNRIYLLTMRESPAAAFYEKQGFIQAGTPP